MNHKLNWYATYTNGSIIHQYKSNGVVLSFANISRINLKSLSITDGKKLIATQNFTPGMSPLYRLRTLLKNNTNSCIKIHILGWVLWNSQAANLINNVTFVDDNTQLVEIGHFINGFNAGYKYPIKFQKEDHTQIVWT